MSNFKCCVDNLMDFRDDDDDDDEEKTTWKNITKKK